MKCKFTAVRCSAMASRNCTKMYRRLKITTKAIDFSAFSHWNIKEEARLERPKSLQLAADTSLELIRTCSLAFPRLLAQFSLLVPVDS